MANVLKMAKKHAIIGLLESGWSYRRIAVSFASTARQWHVTTSCAGQTPPFRPPSRIRWIPLSDIVMLQRKLDKPDLKISY